MNISQLSSVDSLVAADLLAVWDASNSDTRKASLGLLISFLQSSLTQSGNFLTQYASPTATGFSVSISPVVNGQNVYLLLSPTGAFAAGTIVLPALSTSVDGQTILCSCTQAVTTLTVNGNGAGVIGSPTTLAAGSFFRLRFDGVNKNWYRIG